MPATCMTGWINFTRLSSNCTYPDLERSDDPESERDLTNSRLDEVFRRLGRIENHVFMTDMNEHGDVVHHGLLSRQIETHGADHSLDGWCVNPSTAKPQFMAFTLRSSLLHALKEHNTTLEEMTRTYFETLAQWLPIISRNKFEKEQLQFRGLTGSTKFMLQASAMHLVITPFNEHPPAASIEESPWYQSCKLHFAQLVALSEPSIELIQAGMLIALFEYLQAIGNRSLTTLGICANLAYVLELDDVVAKESSRTSGEMNAEEEEVVLTWWGLTRLER